MSSFIVNFIIEKFLSNFIEINKNQTYISLLSGEFVFKNVKLKQKLLEYINIDYLEIIYGYLGSIRIKLSLLNFYSNPIKIYINDLYIYSKQKNLDNIIEKERIQQLISNKYYKLSLDENILQQINETNDTSDNFVNQIIRNINIFTNNIVLRFEDDISCPKSPFSIGLIVKSLNIISFGELINPEDDNNNNFSVTRNNNKKNFDYDNIYIPDNPYEISDKKIIIGSLYFYIDSYNLKEELNFDKFIDEKVKIETSETLESHINEILDFYYYSRSELNINCNKKKAHEYLFYDLNLDINLSMNFNLDNNKPQYQLIINDINNFEVSIKIKQLSLLFNLFSYYNLYYYYLMGLDKSIFNLSLNEAEKKIYIFDYLDYYYNKYILKNDEYSLSNFIREKEEKMTYNDISDLRKISINNIRLFVSIKIKEKKLKDLNSKWFFTSKNKQEIKKLESEIKEMNNLLNDNIIGQITDDKTCISPMIEEIYNNNDIDEDFVKEKNPYKYLPDNFVFFLFKIKILSCHIIIYDNDSDFININLQKGKNKKILDINITELFIKLILGKKLTDFIFELLDMNIKQEIIDSRDYDLILMTENLNNEKNNSNKRKVLSLEFESNTNQNINYNYKIFLKNEKKIIFVLNLFELNYIQNKIITSLYSSILFMDLPHYAQENVNKYYKIGYLLANNTNPKNDNNRTEEKYYNYNCDIDIISPQVIMPQNILDKYNNKCIIINLGDISLKSDLVESSFRNYMLDNPDYEYNNLQENYSEDMYDNYNLNIKGFNILFSNDCLKKDNYNPYYCSNVVNNIDIAVIYRTLIITSNKILNNKDLVISIDRIEINLDEFQLLLLLVFFKQLKIQSDMFKNMQIEQNELNSKNQKTIISFKEHLIEEGILNEKKIEKKMYDNIYKKINSYTNENDFHTKKNAYKYEVKINDIIFKIYKIFPDLENVLFLEAQLKNFNLEMFGNSINDSLMKISIRRLILYDKEKDINKTYISKRDYQTLLDCKEINIKNDMFSYSNIYINGNQENKSEINLLNFNFIVSFEVLTRIYSFLIYYYNIFYENYLNTNQKMKTNLEEPKKIEKDSYDKYLKQNNNQNIIETNKKSYIFKIKLRENYILIPYNNTSSICPKLSFKINMIYEQSSETEIVKIYNNKKNILLYLKQRPDKSSINIIIYESDIDIIKFDYRSNIFLLKKKENRILPNYRIQYTNNYTYLPSTKQILSKTDILIEPIIINMTLDELKDLTLFYNQLMKFLYENLYEIYIPYIKPENVIYSKGKKYIKKKKITIKRLLWRIYIMYKIRKSFDKMKANKKHTKDLNIKNALNDMNININRFVITIFVNELDGKRLLLELKLLNFVLKSINNSNPYNRKNVENELLNIIAGIRVPLEEYIIYQFYRYADISFFFKLNYYNLEYSNFEPLIEPLPFQILSYQVDKIFKQRSIIKTGEIINFNISPASIKVLNLFLVKFYSESGSVVPNSLKIKRNQINIENIKKNNQIVLEISNKTGLPIRFWFDFKSHVKYIINDNDCLSFSNSSLYETRRQQIKLQKKYPEKNTFSFQIIGFEIIPNIIINKNNVLYFKTRNQENQYILYQAIIDTSELVNKIKICSSIFFINKTQFDELIINIDDKHIENNYIELRKGKKCRIPLNWMLSKEKIFFQKKENSIKTVLYNNILDCIFCQKLTDEELEKIYIYFYFYNSINDLYEIPPILKDPRVKWQIIKQINSDFRLDKRYTYIDGELLQNK